MSVIHLLAVAVGNDCATLVSSLTLFRTIAPRVKGPHAKMTDAAGGHPPILPVVEEIEVVVAHQERCDPAGRRHVLEDRPDQTPTDVEVEAMRMAPLATPEFRWRKPPVLALAALPGTALGRSAIHKLTPHDRIE